MKQRAGESYEDFRVRANAADRRRYHERKWQVSKEVRNGEGDIISFTTVPEREPFKQLDGAALKRRSTLVDAEGNVIQSWMIENAEEKERWSMLREQLDEMKRELPRLPTIPMPDTDINRDWLFSIPIGDHHVGMLSWKYETGASYDVDIAEALLAAGTDYLVDPAPACEHCLLAFLGDFVHYDSMDPKTPQHGNILDSDGRKAKIVRAASRMMRRMIQKAAAKFMFVHVILEFGNHDPDATLWLGEMMRTLYEDNPRITIDSSPGSYHYYQFGKNMIATHHGDKKKVVDAGLPGLIAARNPKMWGDTTHRVIWTGHIHHRQAIEYPGCTVESMRVLPPNDAYSHMMGYQSERGMKSVIFRRQGGEIASARFHPEMMEMS